MKNVKRAAIGLVAAAAMLIPAACSESKGTEVKVGLSDYAISASPASVAAGKITFEAKNNGNFVHELLVVKADSVDALPKAADGTVDEDQIAEADIPGEASDINPGKTKDLTVTLKAGTYILLCNRVDGSVSHFKEGMHAVFTVT